jgi:hypothetical protein
MKLQIFLAAAITALLFGCNSTPSSSSEEEVIIPKMQQNTYLSHAKHPQRFGMNFYKVKDGIDVSGQVRQHPVHLANAKLYKNTIPVIDVQGKARRQKMSALLDTSSPVSWIEFSKSQEMGAIFVGVDGVNVPYRGGYNTGDVDAYVAVIPQLRIKQLFMEDAPIYVRMAMNSLGPLARGIKVPHVDAVLGWDILKTFAYIQIDLDAGVVNFSSTHPYIPHQDLLMTSAKIKRVQHYGLAVEGSIFGEPTPIILDFAGDYHFARGDVKVSATKQVSIGDIVYRKVPTLLLPINSSPPRAGRQMLNKYIVTICPKEGVVHFERYPE